MVDGHIRVGVEPVVAINNFRKSRVEVDEVDVTANFSDVRPVFPGVEVIDDIAHMGMGGDGCEARDRCASCQCHVGPDIKRHIAVVRRHVADNRIIAIGVDASIYCRDVRSSDETKHVAVDRGPVGLSIEASNVL